MSYLYIYSIYIYIMNLECSYMFLMTYHSCHVRHDISEVTKLFINLRQGLKISLNLRENGVGTG